MTVQEAFLVYSLVILGAGILAALIISILS